MEPSGKRPKVCRHKHFVLRYHDSELDYKSIAEIIFDGGEYLVVKEYDENGKEHVHFQGLTTYRDETLKTYTEDLVTKRHRLTKEAKENGQKSRRLVSWSHKVCNEDGYAYMSKDARRTVLASTFNEEEIMALGAKSIDYVSKLKSELSDYVYQRMEEWNWENAQKKVYNLALDYYSSKEKAPPWNQLEGRVKTLLFYYKRNGEYVYRQFIYK